MTIAQKLFRSALALSCLLMLNQSAQAYTLDKTNHVIGISLGTNATADIRNALAFLMNRSDKDTQYTVRFEPGKYTITLPLYSVGLQNVAFISDPSNPAVLVKASNFSGSDYLFYTRMSKNVTIKGFEFYGLTDFKNSLKPVWGDQGAMFGSCDTITIDNNKFYNFGNAALRVTTSENDSVTGVNSFNTRVVNNVFNNFYQVSTTSNDEKHGATAHYTMQNNQFLNIRGSVKFASRTSGAKDVHILSNLFNGGTNFGLEIDNYSDFEIRGNTFQNISSVSVNIYTNPRAPKPFQWGDNFTIAGNSFKNVSRGIRFSPDPFADGTRIVPHNLVVDSNTMSGVTNPTKYLPAISVVNGAVAGVKISGNKLNVIASKNYIGVDSRCTSVVKLDNYVDGSPYGTQSTTASGSTDGGTTTDGGSTASTKPAAPSNLTGQYNSGSVKLTWTDNANNESRMEVWGSTNGSQYTLLAKLSANSTVFTHNTSKLTVSTYYYTVRTVNSAGASAFAKVSKVALSGSGTTASSGDALPAKAAG